jgi:phenylalanyl-tRNA synthetase beta chain
MKVPLSWIKEFLELRETPEEISRILTSGGVEVESIESVNGEIVFEISLTPNLGHNLSVLGIARELSALTSLPLKKNESPLKEDAQETIKDQISVSLEDTDQCLRYSCRLFLDVKVGESPEWLKKRLELCGIRSINNVVDVTNYIMLELGQPLHAFDYDHIQGKKICVTSKALASSMMALDEKNYEIPKGTLLIADEKKPLAFAGVMGGLESSVTDKTTRILLESAYFTPQAVRKTSKLLGLRTESSQRFEKEIDLEGVVTALNQAGALIQKLTHAKMAHGLIDERVKIPARKPVVCRVARVNQVLGTSLSLREIVTIFERLQIQVVREEETCLHVFPPSFRNDLKTEIDLIEEVARIYGYENIPLKLPKHITSPLDSSPVFLFEKKMRARLIAEGLQECMCCDLISPSLAELTAEAPDPASWISVMQPASLDQSILRTSLLPGFLQTVQTNRAHQNKDISIFEIGRIHFKNKDNYQEQTMIGILLSGINSCYHFDPKPREVDFFDLKGKVENLLLSLGISEVQFEPSHLHNFHSGRQARIKVGENQIGALGEIHPGRLHTLGIDFRVYFAELNLHDLLRLQRKEWKVEELPQFPGSERDWTLTVSEEIPIESMLSSIQEVNSPYLEKVQLIDIYRGTQVGKEKKNVTFRFLYRDRKKTLSFETIESEHAKMTQEVAKKFANRLH